MYTYTWIGTQHRHLLQKLFFFTIITLQNWWHMGGACASLSHHCPRINNSFTTLFCGKESGALGLPFEAHDAFSSSSKAINKGMGHALHMLLLEWHAETELSYHHQRVVMTYVVMAVVLWLNSLSFSSHLTLLPLLLLFMPYIQSFADS